MGNRYIRPQIDRTGLVLYHKLWAGLTTTATVFDYSLNGNDGTPTGTSIVPAYPGFDLAGSNEYFDVGATLQATFRSSFTCIIWAKLDEGQPAAQEVLMGVIDGDSRMDFAVTGAGKVTFRYISEGNAGTAATTDAAVFASGQADWTQIAVVLDATLEGPGGKVIYVNGALQTLGASDGDTSLVISSAWTSVQDLYIGAQDNGGSDASNIAGLIDEPMIFNVAKTAADMKSIFELTRWRYSV